MKHYLKPPFLFTRLCLYFTFVPGWFWVDIKIQLTMQKINIADLYYLNKIISNMLDKNIDTNMHFKITDLQIFLQKAWRTVKSIKIDN